MIRLRFQLHFRLDLICGYVDTQQTCRPCAQEQTRRERHRSRHTKLTLNYIDLMRKDCERGKMILRTL
jgi:hypothetical protein